MKITLAKTAGFCFGVDRAVSLVEQTVKAGKKAVTLGPIIHNRHVVDRFAALGVMEVASPEEVPAGSAVIIRSHGVSRAVMQALQARELEIIDATCPFVKRIHNIVSGAAQKGRRVIIIGTRTHPEVTAVAGWCDDPVIFETPQELENWLTEDPERRNMALLMVSQTTSTQKLWESCCNFAKKVCTNCEIFDTICEATEKRQEEALALAQKCDVMVVIGDAKSSNTGRLADICRQACRGAGSFPVGRGYCHRHHGRRFHAVVDNKGGQQQNERRNQN